MMIIRYVRMYVGTVPEGVLPNWFARQPYGPHAAAFLLALISPLGQYNPMH
jgi:hypothetical protein